MLEVTDAFLDKDHAISLTTGVSEDVEHISDSGRLVIDPDQRFSSVLQSVIEAKYDKASMQSIFQERGAGILLVGTVTVKTIPKQCKCSDTHKYSQGVSDVFQEEGAQERAETK